MTTLNDIKADIAAVQSASDIIQRDVIAIQKLCGELNKWTTAAFKLNSEPLVQLAPCTQQIDLGRVQNLASQIYQGARTMRGALDKARETFSSLDREDQDRAIQLHPEIVQDAILRVAIQAQTSVSFDRRPAQ
jgi:hypothetical protein